MAQFLTFLFIIIAVVWVVRRFAEQTKSTQTRGKISRRRRTEIHEAAERMKQPEPKHDARPTGPAAITERSQSPPEAARMDDPAGHWVDVLRVGEANSTEEAVRQLSAMGAQAYPELRRALRDPAPHVRAQAQRAVEAIAAEQRHQATQPIPLVARSAPEPPPRPPPPPVPAAEPKPEPPLRRFAPPVKTRAPIPVPEPQPDSDPPEVVAAEEVIVDAVDVAAVLREARGAASFGGDRDELLAQLAGGVLRFAVVVEEVSRTSSFDASPAYRRGATIRAHLPNTDVAVAVRVPPDHLEDGAPLERGREVLVAASFRAWDNLYDRAVFEGTIAG